MSASPAPEPRSRPVEALIAAGMSPGQAARKEPLFANAERALAAMPDRVPGSAPSDGPVATPGAPGTAAPLHRYFVPGRVEFLGKHTDYAGGRSLVCAVEQGICFVGRARGDSLVRVVAAGSGAQAELALRPDLPVPRGDWSAYLATVARRLARDFPGAGTGLNLAFDGDLPPAAGLSSSSALVVGAFLALADANGLAGREDFQRALAAPEQVGDYLGAVENGRAYGAFPGDHGVGTQGGSQDQTTILCARPGMLTQCRWVPARLERSVAFPAGYCLVIGVSGVVAEKAGAAREAYNAASRASVELLALWRRETGRDDPTLGAAVASAPGARAELAGLVDRRAPGLRARLEQFVAESEEIIPAAGDALALGRLDVLGALVDRSQAGAERGLGNQIAETIHLQRSARRLGAVAASAFGAGFGGSVWALVPAADEAAFREAWAAGYAALFPRHAGGARFFATGPGPAAVRLG